MGLERLTLKAITKIDGGRLEAAFDQALHRLQADCKDRPGTKDARKLALHLSLSPLIDEDALSLGSVDVAFHFTETVPKRRSKKYNMRAEAGGLFFEDLSPDDVRQMTIEQGAKPTALGGDEPTQESQPESKEA